MTGFDSKRRMALAKLPDDDDDDTQVYGDALTAAYQRGFADGKKATQRPWVGLTEDEISLIVAECSLMSPSDHYFAQAIEAKLKERNT